MVGLKRRKKNKHNKKETLSKSERVCLLKSSKLNNK
jgi:hypothetical protein